MRKLVIIVIISCSYCSSRRAVTTLTIRLLNLNRCHLCNFKVVYLYGNEEPEILGSCSPPTTCRMSPLHLDSCLSVGEFSSDLYRGSLKHTKPKKGFRVLLWTVWQRLFIIFIKHITGPPQFWVKIGKNELLFFCHMITFLIYPEFKHVWGFKMVGKGCEIFDLDPQFQNDS